MKRNNKLSRKRINSSKQVKVTTPAEHFMSGLNSKESRKKLRRYTFQAHVTFPSQVIKDPEGKEEDRVVPENTSVLKLERILFGISQTALKVCHEEETSLREHVPAFKDCKVIVEATPHETVSDETYRTIMGYQSMAQIYDRVANDLVAANMKIQPDTAKDADFSDLVDKEVERLYGIASEAIMAERKAARRVEDDKAFEALAKEPDVEEPRMKLGIEAVQEALHGTSIGNEDAGEQGATA